VFRVGVSPKKFHILFEWPFLRRHDVGNFSTSQTISLKISKMSKKTMNEVYDDVTFWKNSTTMAFINDVTILEGSRAGISYFSVTVCKPG